MRKRVKYYFLLLTIMMFSLSNFAQYQFQIWGYGNLGGAIYKQDFGTGTGDVNIPGNPLPAGVTDFPYSSDVCPPAGSYSIVEQINTNNCSNDVWHYVSLDHRQEKNGRMMFIHNLASSTSRIVYVDTVNQSLCAGTVYEFSAAIINIDNPGGCGSQPDPPKFSFRLEKSSGALLASYTTPAIEASGSTAGILWKYSVYGLDDTVFENIDKVVLKIKLLPSENNSNCYSDFAIDDIMFSPVGPASQISFNGLAPGTLIAGSCFQDNKSFSMSDTTDPFYNALAYQWQISSDDGTSWQDIAGANSKTYSQNFPVSDTFLFRVRSSDVSTISEPGCGVVSNILTVQVDGIPADFKITSNSPVCAGVDLQFNAEGGATYIWSGPNNFYDDIQSPHIFNCSLADSGTYYVQIKTFGGCTATDSTHVIIKGIRDVKAGPDTLICKGSSVMLNSTPGIKYLWSPANSLSSAIIQNPVATPEVATTYSVEVTSEDGCSDTAQVRIGLLNNIEVKAAISGPGFVCFPADTANFINNSVGNIASSKWDFGNGQTSYLTNPAPQIYSVDVNRQNYMVSLTVADSAGCRDTSYTTLNIEKNCYIAVPTAFTPNGDGLNDYLYPLSAYKATDLTFKVYNRLGQLVFETHDWTNKWNGSVNGEPQPLGIYVWTLEYNDENDKQVSLKGSTMLIR